MQMTNQQILEKAIQKAIKNGLEFTGDGLADPMEEDRTYHGKKMPPAFIFNHDFAKSLWGEEQRVNPNTLPPEERGGRFTGGGLSGSPFEVVVKKGWQYHLQQMVIADDPIKYLGENI